MVPSDIVLYSTVLGFVLKGTFALSAQNLQVAGAQEMQAGNERVWSPSRPQTSRVGQICRAHCTSRVQSTLVAVSGGFTSSQARPPPLVLGTKSLTHCAWWPFVG